MPNFTALWAAILVCALSASTQARVRTEPKTAYDFTFEAIDGTPMPLAGFRGKTLLIVNTASFCGFTHQYAGLQKLYEKEQANGLVVIGVPANDFGAQEPGSNAEIATFCQGAFNITFPLTAKQTVKGENAHPFYRWARTVLGDAKTPRWNFHKYIVDPDGKLVAAFPSTVEPDSVQLLKVLSTHRKTATN
jgi:glutathione peroxidase